MGETDLFRSRLNQNIKMNHELGRLVKSVSLEANDALCGDVYKGGLGMPPLPSRLMAWLVILKHTFDFSDEEPHARWLESPYFRLLCGEDFFWHELPFVRSSPTRRRQHMDEERIAVLQQESPSVAAKTGTMRPEDNRRVVVDTAVQTKNIKFPTHAKLLNRARERLDAKAKKVSFDLCQYYTWVGKLALIRYQRRAYAKQFKRANKSLRTLKIYFGRPIRDITR